MDGVGDTAKELFTYLLVLGLALSFWGNFKADMERRDGVINYTNKSQNSGQVIRQKLYPAGYTNNAGPATVYYQQYQY